jgi:hypothetical protein
VAALTPRIDKLVGRLAGGRGGGAGRPAGGSQPELRPGDAGFAEAVARLVAMPLDQFPREGQLLEVRVPWLGKTLWFVPDERGAEALGGSGVSRGRVWTVGELVEVRALPGSTSHGLRTVALSKLASDGGIVEVKPGGSS